MTTHWDALIYTPGSDRDGKTDAWSLALGGFHFVVTCEGPEWLGHVTLPNNDWYVAYAYPLDERSPTDIDPAGSFAVDRCHSRGTRGPTTVEIATLNLMKRYIFEHCAHQITTGRTTKLEQS
jgi:hypothetical protein